MDVGLYHDFCYSPVLPQKFFQMILVWASVVAVGSSCNDVSKVTSNWLWWMWKSFQKWCQKPPLLAAISQELRQEYLLTGSGRDQSSLSTARVEVT